MAKDMKLILIAGSEEADKDSVIRLALERLRNFIPGFRYVDADGLGVKLGQKLEEVKSFHSRLYEKLEKALVSELRSGKSHIILNGSLTMGTPYGSLPALSQEFFRVFRPDALVIMESSPGDLVRNPRASEEIIRQQELDRSYGAMCASISDTPLKLITIEESNIALSVNELLEYLRMVLKE